MTSRTLSELDGAEHHAPELKLNVQTHENGGGVVVGLAGELDAVTASWLLDCLNERLTPAGRRVSLDLRGLTFLDVAGARAVVTLSDQVTKAHGRLEVMGLEGGPLRTSRVLGLDQFVAIGRSDESARR